MKLLKFRGWKFRSWKFRGWKFRNWWNVEIIQQTESVELVKEIENNDKNTLPRLEDLSEEILSKYQDKQIREICRRENIRIKGTKKERIDRILKFKEYQVNI